jgi:3-oxoacyl-[acyl-carrier protein] reductase
VVTGASRGIGKATAVRLAADGMDVAVNYVRDEAGARHAAKEIEALGRKALVVQADVARWSDVAAMATTVLKAFGTVDVLVNNAGVYERRSSFDLTPEEWDRQIAVNLSSVFYVTKAFLPSLKEGGWGRLVNLSSQIGFLGTDHGPHYAAAKAGIVALTKSFARELAPYGVTANVVAPGAVDTAILAGDTPEVRREREGRIPLGRVGRPEEIANVVAFLASRDADWITGATFHVNGGQLMV